MNADTARDDLAFLRALVTPSDVWQKQFGETYAAAGLCYCVQMLLHGGQFLGLIPPTGPIALAIGFGPTLVFLVLLIGIIWRNRQGPSGGATSKAVGAVFGAVGLANLVLIVVIGSVAWRLQSITVWLIYPCAVMVLQGMAWLVAYMLRRRPWHAAVAGGWFLTGMGMGAAVLSPGWYVITAGLGMFACMLVPGLVMLRQSRSA